MPSVEPDFTVRIVDAGGQPDSTVAVIDGITDLSPNVGDVLQWDGSAWVNVPADTPGAHAASHAAGGGDAVTLTEAQVTSLQTDLAALVPKSLFDANTMLIATSDNTPVALTVGASTIVGRKASGGIVALTGAEALTITGAAADSLVVHNSGTENIGGTKTFTTGMAASAGNFRIDSSGRLGLGGSAAGSDKIVVSASAHPGSTTTLYGIAMQTVFPTTTTAQGTMFYGAVNTAAATAMTLGQVFYAAAPSIGGGGTLATAIGFYGASQAAGSWITNAYGMWLAATSGAATLNVGARIDTATTAALWLGGDATGTALSGGVAYGSGRDVSHYRSGSAAFTIDAASGTTFTGIINLGVGTAAIAHELIINAPANQQAAIEWKKASANKFWLYMGASDANLYLRDMVNARMHVTFTPGATVGAAITEINSTLLVDGDMTHADATNVILNTSTGTKIGTATGQKLAFHNSTPVIQRAGAAQAAVVTTASTQTVPFGYATQAQADAIVTLVNELRAALVEKGLIKGAA